jgi:hypothetical protein
LNCTLCNLPNENSLIRIPLLNGENINVCQNCQDDIYENGIRYDVDIMIVPITEDSFIFTKNNKLYVHPSKYVKKRPKFIAFYRGGNIAAITHISKVINIIENINNAKTMIYLNNKEFGKWVKEEEFTIYYLDKILSLKNPIKKSNYPPIQNRSHKSFKKFQTAKFLKDLV